MCAVCVHVCVLGLGCAPSNEVFRGVSGGRAHGVTDIVSFTHFLCVHVCVHVCVCVCVCACVCSCVCVHVCVCEDQVRPRHSRRR